MKKTIFLFVITAIAGFSCSPRLSPDSYWGEQRWVLVELKEVPVQQSGSRKDAFIEFSPSEKKFAGNGGCNRISGNYTLEKKSRIRFGEVISTKMSCTDIAFENTFLATLAKVDRFKMDGNILLLKDGNDILMKLEGRNRANRTFQQDGANQ
jgi:heat shock protein HslJ